MAPATAVARCVDDDGKIMPKLAGADVLIEINEELAADDFESPSPLEVLTGQADLAVKFVEFEHDETTSFCHQRQTTKTTQNLMIASLDIMGVFRQV